MDPEGSSPAKKLQFQLEIEWSWIPIRSVMDEVFFCFPAVEVSQFPI